MDYSKQKVGIELKQQLDKSYDIDRISDWAYDLIVSLRHERLAEINDILENISIMDAGPEFEYSEEELRLLAEMLINNEENPIQQINDMKSKGSI